jgi:hypothetical protein
VSGEPYDSFQEDFREGWRLFREVRGLTRSNYLRGVSRFYREVTQLDTRLEGAISEEIARVHGCPKIV